jgi:non-specific serine/threonine protein kinase
MQKDDRRSSEPNRPLASGDPTQWIGGDDPDTTMAPAGPVEPVGEVAGPPESIGAYRILGELGRGGMGVVYLALDPRLDRRIALKVLPERLAGDPLIFSYFQREARLLASINNPNIATIHSLESTESIHFLTMELIDGRSLATALGAGPLGVDASLSLCRQIAVALEAAHRNGIVHLDLKPQNVMITDEGLVKVLDFGVAMALGIEVGEDGERRSRARVQDAVSGTPGYMSPEQIRGEEVDAHADLFAFGCILFECLAGKPAFPGYDARERLRVTLEDPLDLGAIAAVAPPRIGEIIARCTAKSVAERPASLTAVRRLLEEEIALRALPAPAARAEDVPNNLPAPLTGFIGREKQKSEVADLLQGHRLVTLTGVGGGGKTRLSIEVARSLLAAGSEGVWFVELAALASGDLVPGAVAAVLQTRDEAGVTPEVGVARAIGSRSVTLVLDNCEHLLDDVSRLASTLLASCPGLRILATSREALGVAGETPYHVPSLAVPRTGATATVEELSANESVQLFVARASAVNPSFRVDAENAAAVALICRSLDGIPLALELAAARVKVLPPDEIAKRLSDRFRLLSASSRTALPRHQTLRALIDWSYDHLTESEQGLLRRLSLFAGGWTLDAAESVCAGDGIEDWEILDGLSSLLDKSLVESDVEGGQGTGKPRYRMLETIREYAHARLLERREGAETLDRHRSYFLDLAEDLAAKLAGPEQAISLRRLAAEHENLRLALDMCAAPDVDVDLGWRLAGALGRYWFLRGHWNEGRREYGRLMELPPASRKTPAAANAINWAGNLAKLQGDLGQARALLEESLAIRRSLDEPAGIASSLNNLGNVLKDQGDLDGALALYKESLALQRSIENRPGIAVALSSLGLLSHMSGQLEAARSYHDESLRLRRELGDRSNVAASLNNLGLIAEALGDPEAAIAHLEECTSILRELGDRWGDAAASSNLGRLAEAKGDHVRARDYLERALVVFRELGDRRGSASTLNSLGLVLEAEGDREGARQSLRESLTIFHQLGELRRISSLLNALGGLESAEDPPLAARLLGAAEAIRGQMGIALDAADLDRFQREMDFLRDRMGVESLASCMQEGRSLGPDGAAALILRLTSGEARPQLAPPQ